MPAEVDCAAAACDAGGVGGSVSAPGDAADAKSTLNDGYPSAITAGDVGDAGDPAPDNSSAAWTSAGAGGIVASPEASTRGG